MSKGIKIIAILEILKGLIGLIWLSSWGIAFFLESLWLYGVLTLICGFKILLGMGLLKKQDMARKMILILWSLIIVLAGYIISAYYLPCVILIMLIIGIFVALVFIYYFTKKEIVLLFH